MKRILVSVLALLLPLVSYSRNTDTGYWRSVAERMSSALLEHFWNPDRGYFHCMSDGADTTTSQYWPEAHAMDVVIDAYLRSSDRRYLDIFPLWWTGIPDCNFSGRSEDPWWNPYVDDMEWIALAQIRMYLATGNRTYLSRAAGIYNDWIWTRWGPEDEAPWFGGITWCTDRRKSKNACSNGPAAIIAARLSRLVAKAGLEPRKKSADYLSEAERIYAFERRVLFDTVTGAVRDNINDEGRISQAVFTYNQGTFIGAAVELHQITGDSAYLRDAVKAADYVLDRMVTESGTLRDAVGGDGGLFHGILFRYMALLAQCPGVDGARYRDFMLFHAETMANEALDPKTSLFCGRWHSRPEEGAPVPLTSHLSGCMLAEAVCEILKTMQ